MADKRTYKQTLMKYCAFIFMFMHFLGLSQNLNTELPSKTLYQFGQINDYSLLFAKNKPDTFDYSAKFTTTNKIILTAKKSQQIDSSYSYIINDKNTLTIIHRTNDSSTRITYECSNSFRDIEVSFNSKSKVLTLKNKTSKDSSTNRILSLYKKGKTRDIIRYDDIFIHTKTTLADASILKERCRGRFYKITKDTLFIDQDEIASDHFYETGHDTLPTKLIKIGINSITKISHKRESFQAITTVGIGLSALSTLIVAPLVSLNKSGFNSDRYLKVAGVSLASTILFTTLRITFSHKKMKVGVMQSNWQIP